MPRSMMMLKSLTAALTFALATTALVGCSSQTDDIYTADEQHADIGAIARDEVAFPLQVGVVVPNAEGRATKLTRTMQGIRVDLYDMTVIGNCESDENEQGEFYYQVDLDGRSLAHRDSDHTASAYEDGSIPLSARRVFFVEPTETFDLNFQVSEQDDFLNGKDDYVGNYGLAFTTADLASGSFSESFNIGSGRCQVQAKYSLTRVQ